MIRRVGIIDESIVVDIEENDILELEMQIIISDEWRMFIESSEWKLREDIAILVAETVHSTINDTDTVHPHFEGPEQVFEGLYTCCHQS